MRATVRETDIFSWTPLIFSGTSVMNHDPRDVSTDVPQRAQLRVDPP